MPILCSMHRPPSILHPLRFGDEFISASYSVTNLGVIFNRHIRMNKQISAIVRSSFCSLRNMYKARRCLTRETCEMMVHAFITKRLDYCNALLYGLPKRQIKKLQRVQNSAAWFVIVTMKYDHITPVLIELHWLPVEKQTVFKILFLTFQCLHGLAPSYLSDLNCKTKAYSDTLF